MIDADTWRQLEAGYDSETMVSQAASRYVGAGPSGGAARLANNSSSTPRTFSSPTTHSAGVRTDRYLQLIHGELTNISASMRIMANHVSSGTSRGSAKASIERLLNTDLADDEDGQFTHTCSLARSPLIIVFCDTVNLRPDPESSMQDASNGTLLVLVSLL